VSVVLVDWLGRGGIAQTSDAWVRELRGRGVDVTLVTRSERELAGDVVAPDRGGRVANHWRLARLAARTIAELRPSVVVVQNYVVPPLERRLYAAAREAGARVIVVVHDHRLHTRLAGTSAGLRASLRSADVLVAHTQFVAGEVARFVGRTDVEVVPLPVQVGMLAGPSVESPLPVDSGLLALHFGVVKRRYKGSDVVLAMARAGVDGWRFAVLGTGAPEDPSVFSMGGFVETPVLVGAVRQSHATVLPYRLASQSGAVVLAQALGSVAVASSVGGIPDQIVDGVTGRLVPADASPSVWAGVLHELTDGDVRATIAGQARESVYEGHERFVKRIVELVG
jgi:glycosyltransferase involved in cell wall biosynthesis